MSTLESLWFKKNNLPKNVLSLSSQTINAMNKKMMKTPYKKKSKRGKYNELTSSNKLLVARYVSYHRVTKTLKKIMITIIYQHWHV